MAKKSVTILLIAAVIGSCMPLLGCTQAAQTAQAAQAATPQDQVNALEGLFGKQSTYRRAQAKGVCASGYFVGDAAGRALSSASAFNGKKIPVIARFSVGGGNPKATDKAKSVRGMALQFSLPKDEQWMMENMSTPMYFVSKPEQFAPFLKARMLDPATGKPGPAKVKAFSDANPETLGQAAFLAAGQMPTS